MNKQTKKARRLAADALAIRRVVGLPYTERDRLYLREKICFGFNSFMSPCYGPNEADKQTQPWRVFFRDTYRKNILLVRRWRLTYQRNHGVSIRP